MSSRGVRLGKGWRGGLGSRLGYRFGCFLRFFRIIEEFDVVSWRVSWEEGFFGYLDFFISFRVLIVFTWLLGCFV